MCDLKSKNENFKDVAYSATFRQVSRHQCCSEFPFQRQWWQLAHYWQCFSHCCLMIYLPQFCKTSCICTNAFFVELYGSPLNPFLPQNDGTFTPPSSSPSASLSVGHSVLPHTSFMKIYYGIDPSIWSHIKLM